VKLREIKRPKQMEVYMVLKNYNICQFSPKLTKIQHNPNQYPVRPFVDTDKLILKFTWKYWGMGNNQNFDKEEAGGLTLPAFKTNYKDIVIKTV